MSSLIQTSATERSALGSRTQFRKASTPIVDWFNFYNSIDMSTRDQNDTVKMVMEI